MDLANSFIIYSTLQGGVFGVAGTYFLSSGVVFGPNSTPKRKKYASISNQQPTLKRGVSDLHHNQYELPSIFFKGNQVLPLRH